MLRGERLLGGLADFTTPAAETQGPSETSNLEEKNIMGMRVEGQAKGDQGLRFLLSETPVSKLLSSKCKMKFVTKF